MKAKQLLLAQYDLNNVLFNNVIAGISNEEANEKPGETMNNVRWIAGHWVWAQGNFAKFCEVGFEVSWTENFARNAPFSNSADLPQLDEIRAKWNELATQVRAGLENLSEDTLSSPVEFNHPISPFDKTMAGLLAFLIVHQSCHIGQISILRRGLGKEPMTFV